MDQDAFRVLLTSSRRSQPNAKQAVPTTAKSIPQKATTSASSEPAFKPRKVKKTESKYRNRAAERREGTGNDYAQVEAVLEDFEKRVAHEDRDVVCLSLSR
jgi:IK cytokine